MGTTSGVHAKERLTFGYFMRELQHYLHMEKGLLHTFADLLRRPGTMLPGYLDGTGRAGYTNPIAYFLLAAAVSLLAYGLYREPYRAWVRGDLSTMRASTDMAVFMRAYSSHIIKVTEYRALNSMLLVVPLGTMFWLLFRGPRFNLAEALAVALYSVGTYLFAYALLVTPLLYFSHAWRSTTWTAFAMQMAIVLWFGFGLFGRGRAQAGKLLLAVLVSFGAWIGALSLGVMIYTALTL